MVLVPHRLTQAVLEKRPLNGCLSVVIMFSYSGTFADFSQLLLRDVLSQHNTLWVHIHSGFGGHYT